jgi:hypothetical protein
VNKPEREGFVDDQPADNVDTKAPPPAPEPPPLAAETWPVVVKLVHKPVRKSLNETLNELTFREPTAGDILRCGGNPCRIDTLFGQGITIDDRKMMTLMANLSGVMEPFLQQMDPRDYNSCAYRLQRFFLPEPEAAW